MTRLNIVVYIIGLVQYCTCSQYRIVTHVVCYVKNSIDIFMNYLLAITIQAMAIPP